MNTNQSFQTRIGGYKVGQKPTDAKSHETGRFDETKLPPKVDLRKYMTDVEEQVGNSCVANAFVGAYEYLAKRSMGSSGDVSRLFVYYNARAELGDTDRDGGTAMSAAIQGLVKYGACSEEYWSNESDLITQEPDETAYEHAAYFKITEAEYIKTDLNLWRHTLAEGHPIAFALNLFKSFDEANRNQGRIGTPKKADNLRENHAWHAMLCVGYSDRDRMFIVRNSWGSEWGDKGYCYIPYDYVIHPEYNGHDSWIIKSLTDLDFSADVWEDDESFFADEDSLLLYNFYIRTEDSEGFIEALEELCENWVETEDDYYFDYEEEENEDDITLFITNFDIAIEDTDEFLEELDELSQEYAVDDDYDYGLEEEEEE